MLATLVSPKALTDARDYVELVHEGGTRTTLNERKVVERAKGLLMAHRHLTEAEAYKALRQMAMNQNRRLLEVAEAVLTAADVLPGRTR